MIRFSVTQNGKKLSKTEYSWDEKTLTFSTKENNLVLYFSDVSGVTFNTGWGCTFKTGSHCTFTTYSNCTFTTGDKCVVVRKDVYEVIELKENQKIKLNGFAVKGYKVIE